MQAGLSNINSVGSKTVTVFVPKMKKAGASDEILRQIIDNNPRRSLAFVPEVNRKSCPPGPVYRCRL
jgi:predicted metal-dependent phosphotriesterase family hydrolase